MFRKYIIEREFEGLESCFDSLIKISLFSAVSVCLSAGSAEKQNKETRGQSTGRKKITRREGKSPASIQNFTLSIGMSSSRGKNLVLDIYLVLFLFYF